MASKFDFKSVEKKWQDYWYKNNIYEAIDNDESRKKKYILVEFPFPSGASLHVGHLFRYTVPDIYSRFLRMRGYNVMFPMGWDAFGLPAEEYARKTGVNPKITTETNIANLKQNIQKMGYGVDWNREFATTDPDYYKWTQWIFKKFYEAGLAEKKDIELWWCENLGTVLANEEVYDGENGQKLSERGDHPVERKTLSQWIIKITEYGQKLLDGLEQTHFPESVKAMQREWIGRSEGVVVDWDLVPDSYIDHTNAYPDFDKDNCKDYKLIIRERSTGFIRIKETGKFVSYSKKRDKNNYNFLPGGAIDPDETPQMTFIRETDEELGLENLEYVSDLGSVNTYSKWQGRPQHSIEHYFLFEISQSDLKDRKQGEIDDSTKDDYGDIKTVDLTEFRNNNWSQLNTILDNLEELEKTGKITMVENQNRDILLATSNQAKIDRYKNFINFNGVNLKSPSEVGIEKIDVPEDGGNELENAKAKARAYFDVIQEPSMGLDSGFYIPGIPEDRQPGKNTKRIAGVEDSDDKETKFDKMTKFYIDLVNEFGVGGELEGYYLDSYAIYDGMNYYTAQAKRHVTLTNKINDRDNLDFPMCSIYRGKNCDVYHNEMTPAQESEFLKPSRLAAYNLVHNFLFDSEQLTPEANSIKTFTTRVDTLPSSTFVIVSPEYTGLLEMTSQKYQLEVTNYIEMAKNKSERERQINKEKTAAFTGRFVRHPLNNQLLPVWVSDFVLGGYGTGAVMADAHDERDAELAIKYGIFLDENISDAGQARKDMMSELKDGKVFVDYGILFNSGKYDGLTSQQALEQIADDLVVMGKGEKQINYKFRDWVFSRQRFWGEPFPIEYVEGENGEVEIRLIDDKDLPLVLPDLEDFEPNSDGRSPLAKSDWIRVDERTTREADTMPNWAGSNWYYLRFCDPKNDQEFASQKNLNYWLPVDHYFGGGEHTTMHLLYSRFGHQFLFDQKLVPTPEPYDYRHNGGILLGPDGSKMSKSKGNVIVPDDKLKTVGADALRLYVCFIGPYDATVTWQEGGLNRCKKLVDDIWLLREKVGDGENDKTVVVAYHKMLKKITMYLQSQKNNVAVSELMSFVNLLKDQKHINREIWQNFVLVLAPFAPHLAEEIGIEEYCLATNKKIEDIDWSNLPNDYGSVHKDPWPEYDEALTVDDEVKYAVQINGKVRAEFQIARDATDEEVLAEAKTASAKWLEGKELKFHKIIPAKLVTLVVK